MNALAAPTGALDEAAQLTPGFLMRHGLHDLMLDLTGRARLSAQVERQLQARDGYLGLGQKAGGQKTSS